LRVLYDHQIFSSQPQGGVSRYFAELVRGLPSLGVGVQTGWDYTANRYLHEANPRFRDWAPGLRFKGKAHLTGWWNRGASQRALRSSEWDLFHPTYYDPYFLPLLKGRPFVLTIHDMTHELYPEGLSDRGVVPARKRMLANRARLVIAVSENTRADAIRLLGLDPAKVVTVPHGNSLRPGLVVPAKVPADPGYWLYVGTRSGYKNWALVVEALAQRANATDRLVMVGGGPLTNAERRQLDLAGLGSRAVQTGASDAELAGWYRGAQALIYPSKYEGFGMPLLEAMAWGCPVVAARASCLPEVGGDAALYFAPESCGDLVTQLERLSDPAECQSYRAAGLAREALFGWRQTLAATAAVYQGCL